MVDPDAPPADTIPEVSVVIPTRDRWHLLSRTLRSVLRQEGVDLEVLVVDDGSVDGTALRIAELGDRRVRCVSSPVSEGVVRARNRGIADAGAPWVAFLDDDDLWAPRKLRAQLDTAAATGARFIYCSALVVDASLNALLIDPAPPPEQLSVRLLSTNVIPAGSSNVLIDRGLLVDLGGFDHRLASLADWDLWIRICSREPAAACPEVLVAYVEHDGSMHASDLEARGREFAYLASKHEAACDGLGRPFGGSALARSVARHQRASGHRLAAARTYLRAAVAHRRPGLAGRAAAALLGDRANQLMRRVRGAANPTVPEWLDAYRYSTDGEGGPK